MSDQRQRRSPLAELQCNRFRPSDCSEFEASGTCKAAASCDGDVEKEASENSSTAGKNICRLPTDGDNSLQSCSTDRLCEEFDEELIQELDALCEKRSKGPHDGRKLSMGQELHSLSTHVSTVCWRGDLQERMLANYIPQSTAPCSDLPLQFPGIAQFGNVTSTLPGSEDLAVRNTCPRSPCLLLDLADQALLSPIHAPGPNLANPKSPTSFATPSAAIVTSVSKCPPTGTAASPVLVQGVLVSRAGSPSPPTEMPEYLRTLNATQREVALSDTSKPLLILAGPGSGKVQLPYLIWLGHQKHSTCILSLDHIADRRTYLCLGFRV